MMKYLSNLFTLLVIALMAATTISCGGSSNSDEPDNPGKDTVTRVQDRDGMIFLENGKLVAANTSFSTALLSQALTQTNWKLDYGFIYDDKHISGIYDLNSGSYRFPIMLMTDKTALFQFNSHRPCSLSGKVLTIAVDPVQALGFLPTNTQQLL